MFISLPFVLALIFMLVKQIVLYVESQSGWDLCVDTHICLDCAGSWLMPSKIHLFYIYFIIKPTLCFCLELVLAVRKLAPVAEASHTYSKATGPRV